MPQMKQPERVEIGEHIFYIHKMNAVDALSASGDLLKVAGPAIAEFIAASQGEAAEMDPAKLKAALNSLFMQMSGNELIKWVNRLVTKDIVAIEKDNGPIKLQNVERDNLDLDVLLALLYHSGRVNLIGPLVKAFPHIGLGQETAGVIQSGVSATN